MVTRRTRLAQLALPLFALAAALGVAELVLRGLRPRAVGVALQPCLYEPDPELGFRYRPGARGRLLRHFEIDREVRIDSQGHHDVERDPAPRPGLRVAAVGDSFTAALTVGIGDAWTQRLEEALRVSRDPRAEVWNLGLDGTGTDVHLSILEHEVPRLRPDLVLLAFYANDVEDVALGRFGRECHEGFVLAWQTAGQRARLRAEAEAQEGRRLARAAFEGCYLFRLAVYAALGSRNPFHGNFLLPPRAEVHADAAGADAPALSEILDRLLALGRRHGHAFRIVPVPARRSATGSLDVLRRHAPGFEAWALDVAPGMQARAAREGLNWQDLYWHRDDHLNVAGNRLFAAALLELLEPGLLAGRREGKGS